MALGSTQPLTEMSTRNLPGGKRQPKHGADNLTAICDPTDCLENEATSVCMYVCIRGGLLQPLHLDPQWSIVLNPYDR
jgi:hypothetical protein